jgi:hypothetical protein
MIQLSRDDFIEMYRLNTIGRLVHGLVHNLNGPLQNLGMDMDMIGFSLGKGEESAEELLKEIGNRIGRMEEEFERINRLIRAAAARCAPDDEEAGYMNLGDFLDEEIDFLKANLYFKHHVTSDIALKGDLPAIRLLPRGSAAALRGLLDAVVMEMERKSMEAFSLKASAEESGTNVRIFAGSSPFSEPFLDVLQGDPAKNDSFTIRSEQMGIAHASLLLRAAGIRTDVESGPQGTRVSLSL